MSILNTNLANVHFIQCYRACSGKCTCNHKHLIDIQKKELRVGICAALNRFLLHF